MSERASSLSPVACSGLMYCGVPTTIPSVVSCDTDASCAALAIPKSVTSTWPPRSSRMLSGFTSTSRCCRRSRTRNTAANPPSPSSAPTVNSSPRACCNRWRNVEISRDMADAKRRKARAVALGTAGLALVWVLAVWPPPLWWRGHWPRETAMMREAEGWNDGRTERSNAPSVHPTALRAISPMLQRMVIIGEDSRFRTHHGIDPAEIADALGADRGDGPVGTIAAVWRNRERLRGASTITQQLAKNLYLSSSRNPLRKLKEAVTALRLELALPKDRILEL